MVNETHFIIRNSFHYNDTIMLGKKVIVTLFVTLLVAPERLLTAPEWLLSAPERIFGFRYIFCFVTFLENCFDNVSIML